MSDDVLIGSIKNYSWEHIRTFVVSVDRSRFQGKKVMFTEDIQIDAKWALRGFGWEQVEVISDPNQDYGTARHIPVLDYLKRNPYRHVIYCDVRDVIFQSDPVEWMENHLAPKELIGASECVLLKDQSTNMGWLQRTMGPLNADALKGEDVLCAGTIVGCGGAVILLLDDICRMSRNISGWGYDQAYLNYLLRDPAYRNITSIPRMGEGFIATCSWFLSWPRIWENLRTDESPDFDLASATVYKPGTKEPFCIVHQYDRDQEWDKAIRSKYV